MISRTVDSCCLRKTMAVKAALLLTRIPPSNEDPVLHHRMPAQCQQLSRGEASPLGCPAVISTTIGPSPTPLQAVGTKDGEMPLFAEPDLKWSASPHRPPIVN